MTRIIYNAIKHGDLLSDINNFDDVLQKENLTCTNLISHILIHRYVLYKNSLKNIEFLVGKGGKINSFKDIKQLNKTEKIQIYIVNNLSDKITEDESLFIFTYCSIIIINEVIKYINFCNDSLTILLDRFNLDIIKDNIYSDTKAFSELSYEHLLIILFREPTLLFLNIIDYNRTLLAFIYKELKCFIDLKSSERLMIFIGTKSLVYNVNNLYEFLRKCPYKYFGVSRDMAIKLSIQEILDNYMGEIIKNRIDILNKIIL